MDTFRQGDVCTIEVVVESRFNDTNVRVRHVDSYTDIHVKPKDLTMVRPQFEVGGRVEWKSAGDFYRGEVLAISGEHLWIDRGEGNYATVWTGLATRLDPEPDFDEIADDPSSPIPDLEPRVPRFDDGEDRSVEAE